MGEEEVEQHTKIHRAEFDGATYCQDLAEGAPRNHETWVCHPQTQKTRLGTISRETHEGVTTQHQTKPQTFGARGPLAPAATVENPPAGSLPTPTLAQSSCSLVQTQKEGRYEPCARKRRDAGKHEENRGQWLHRSLSVG